MSIKSIIKNTPFVGQIAQITYGTLFSNHYEGRDLTQQVQLFNKMRVQEKFGYPRVIGFEPISRCILNCEFCMLKDLETWKYRRKTRMEFEEFKKIIDDIAFFTTDIQFSGGEPLLNKDIFRMFRYAREKNIYTVLATNAQLLGYRNNLEDIMENPPDKMLIAYESVDKETYEAIRRKGKHDVLVNNIQALIEEKKRRKQKYPIIILQMVLTKKNMHQVELFWKSVKALGADYGSVKALGVWPEGSPEYERKMAEEYLVPHSENPISRHEVDENGNVVWFREVGQCPAVRHCFIGSGGEVYPCWYIVIKMPTFGNAVDDNFVDIWNSEAYREYRDKMLNDWAHPLCHKCIGVGATGDRRKL